PVFISTEQDLAHKFTRLLSTEVFVETLAPFTRRLSIMALFVFPLLWGTFVGRHLLTVTSAMEEDEIYPGHLWEASWRNDP
ncbi:unnamed protein product, partial [Symbiodinium sp. CCMP2456]